MTGRIGDTLADLVRGFLGRSEESSRAFLRQSWLSNAVASLRLARHRSGLTQAEIAQRMGTSQSAIARLEADIEGRIALHRYIDYASACGMMPLDVTLEPFALVREYAMAKPEKQRQQAAYNAWLEDLTRRNASSVSVGTAQAQTETKVSTIWWDLGLSFDEYASAINVNGSQVSNASERKATTQPAESSGESNGACVVAS
ncbi:MAG: helix-turn-helix domain-containing protein [Chloroflexota bacterium]